MRADPGFLRDSEDFNASRPEMISQYKTISWSNIPIIGTLLASIENEKQKILEREES